MLRYTLASSAWAAILVCGLIAAQSLGVGKIKAPDLDEAVDVKLVTELPLEEPAKEPEPEPAPEPAPPVAAPAALVVPKSMKVVTNVEPIKPPDVPLEVPKAPLKEEDPSKDKGVAGVHEGNVGEGKAGGLVGGKGHTPGASVTAAPKPPPPPSAKPVAPPKPKIAIAPEGSDPPDCSGMPNPTFPEEARNMGIEGKVIAKCQIAENGTLELCKVLKGDPVFHSSVLSVVQGFRCKKPYMLDGRPVSAGKAFTFRMMINQ